MGRKYLQHPRTLMPACFGAGVRMGLRQLTGTVRLRMLSLSVPCFCELLCHHEHVYFLQTHALLCLPDPTSL